MGFVESIKTCLKKYATFSGRASRSEFWWWVLFVAIYFSFAKYLYVTLDGYDIATPETRVLIIFISIIFLVLPTFSVGLRRALDSDIKSRGLGIFIIIFWASTYFLNIATILGDAAIMAMFLYKMCKKGTIGDNRFGKDPLEIEGKE